MKEKKNRRKWWTIIIILLVVFISIIIGAVYVLRSGGLVELGRVAIDKMDVAEKVTEKIESGELPEKIELPQEVLDELTGAEQETASESEAPLKYDFKPVPKSHQEQTTQSGGEVDYSQGIDLSYASAIASVASGADIAAAYNAVLGCLSSADKRQIASYLKNGQEGAAYNLVASRLTGGAYATLASLYYKYLPMVQ